jgi:hypothetical protein
MRRYAAAGHAGMIALARARRGTGLGRTDHERRLPLRTAAGVVACSIVYAAMPAEREPDWFEQLRRLASELSAHRAGRTSPSATATAAPTQPSTSTSTSTTVMRQAHHQ